MSLLPSYFVTRPDGPLVAIVFADDLEKVGVHVLGAPSSLAKEQAGCMGFLGDVESQLGMYQVDVDAAWFAASYVGRSAYITDDQPGANQVLQAEYYVRRNGIKVAAILVDELPYGVNFVEFHRNLSFDFVDKNQMEGLGTVPHRPDEHSGVHEVRFSRDFIRQNGLENFLDEEDVLASLPAPSKLIDLAADAPGVAMNQTLRREIESLAKERRNVSLSPSIEDF
jgi:hypothetical protein